MKVSGGVFIFSYKYGVIGQDLRQAILLEELEKEDSCICYDVKREASGRRAKNTKEGKEAESFREAVTSSENILLPIPFSKGNRINLSKQAEITTEELLELLRPGQRIFGGAIEKVFFEKAEKKGISCHDYMREESIAVYNSIATAEGTIVEIVRTTPYNLHKLPVLVLGFGRCGKTLVQKLKSLEADVTVYARRREARMEAYSLGAKAIDRAKLTEEIRKYRVIVNTIPERIFTKEEIESIDRKAKLYEIASFPYCMDQKEAMEAGVQLQVCSGLPGKYSPVSSALVLKEFIMERVK